MSNSIWLPEGLVERSKVTLTLTELQDLIQKYAGISMSLGVDAKAGFGDRVRALRMDAELTTEQLGKRIGAASSTLRHWEHGSGNPSFRYVTALAKEFNIAPAQLFPQIPYESKLEKTLPEALRSDEVTEQIANTADVDDSPGTLDEDTLDFLNE